MPTESVIYKGEIYYIQSSGRYYESRRKILGERSLHRRVWVEHNGPIPEKHDIHHKDENWRNNDIDNLECLPMFDHRSAHMKERLSDPHYYNQAVGYLHTAQFFAKDWHKSEVGRAWHSEHAKNTIAIKEAKTYKCDNCGVEFKSLMINDNKDRYCTVSCRQKDYYKKNRVNKICVKCNKEFSCYKYRDTKYCGYKCSNSDR